jgi:hypothetical protein
MDRDAPCDGDADEPLPPDVFDPAVVFDEDTAAEKTIRTTWRVRFVLMRRESVEPVEDSVWTRLKHLDSV